MKPLTSRPHTIWIEDDLWNAALKLGPAREVVNTALRGFLEPSADTTIGTAPNYRPETISVTSSHTSQAGTIGNVTVGDPEKMLSVDMSRPSGQKSKDDAGLKAQRQLLVKKYGADSPLVKGHE